MDPFVGRRRELATLRARLDDARQGRPWVVAVQGPAGIGKRRCSGSSWRRRRAREHRRGRRAREGADEDHPRRLRGRTGIHGLREAARSPRPTRLRGAGPAGAVERGPGRGAARPWPRDGQRRSRSSPTPAYWGCSVRSRAPVPSSSSSTTCARRTARRCARWYSRCAGWWPTRCWSCWRRATTRARSCRRACAGSCRRPRRHRASRRPGRGRPRELAGGWDRGAARPRRAAAGDGTRGNPLHARAVLGGCRARRGAGRVGAPAPAAPAPRSFRRLVGDRYAACAERHRRLVDAAAVLGMRSPLPLAASVGEVGEPVQAVDEAVARGLLIAETAAHPSASAFPDPLVRSAVHDALGRLGAGRCTSPPPSWSRARSRCWITGSPRRRPWTVRSPTTSRRSPAGRPRPAVAERHAPLVESARLCPDRDKGRRRLLVALSWMLQAATRRVPPRSRRAACPARRAAARQRARRARHGPRRSGRGRGDDDSAWKQGGGTGSGGDGEITGEWLRRSRCRGAVHRSAGSRVRRPSTGRSAPWTSGREQRRPRARTYLANGLATGADGRGVRGARGAQGEATDPEVASLRPRSARGCSDGQGRPGRRARRLWRVATRAESRHAEDRGVRLRLAGAGRIPGGAWDDAVVHAERAVAMNGESTRADLVDGRRDRRPCPPPGGSGLRRRRPRPAPRPVSAGLGAVRRRGGDEPGPPRRPLRRADPGRRPGAGPDVPVRRGRRAGFWAWQDLCAEGLVGVGRVEEADALGDRTRSGPPSAAGCRRSRASRARGRVRPPRAADRAEAAFERALDAAGQVRLPFERGKVELAAGGSCPARAVVAGRGSAHERGGRVGPRRRAVRARCRVSWRLGAPRPRATAAGRRLTSQELVVAPLAAAGRTNRDRR